VTEPDPAPTEPTITPPPIASRLADGQWHRLHPATPLLRGGIAFVAILGIVLVNLRDLWIEILIGGPGDDYEPLEYVLENGLLGLVLLAVLLGLLLTIGGFWLSWRMHTFRITDELVEVRSGILFRTHRRGRLDRIQGINIVRPFLARLFGAAKLEVNVAGQDANVALAYLGSAAVDELRRDVLLLASGTRAEGPSGDRAQTGDRAESRSVIERRVNELLAPELDPDAAPPESVVQLNAGRLVGSIALSALPLLLIAIGLVVGLSLGLVRSGWLLFSLVPVVIGFGGYYLSRITKSLRYSIAATPDGVRVGHGLFTTSNETLPPGRIHAVQVSQPLVWRPFGWWEIKINRASQSQGQGAAGQANTTILPVGNLADVHKVLELIVPTIANDPAVASGLGRASADDGFVNSPPRARVLRWFSRKRNGFALRSGVVLLRRGAIWRELVIVPQARLQSVALRQGPVLRALRLASIRLHTVAGPVSAQLGAIDAVEAERAFVDIADAAVASADSDTSHRWRESPA
jgi:putative membrane protein